MYTNGSFEFHLQLIIAIWTCLTPTMSLNLHLLTESGYYIIKAIKYSLSHRKSQKKNLNGAKSLLHYCDSCLNVG